MPNPAEHTTSGEPCARHRSYSSSKPGRSATLDSRDAESSSAGVKGSFSSSVCAWRYQSCISGIFSSRLIVALVSIGKYLSKRALVPAR